MQFKAAKKVHYESGPDMTPLVDVVMVLLIFLMMVGKFGGRNRVLETDRPITSTGAASEVVDPSQVPKQDITIAIISPTEDRFRALYGKTINVDNNPEELAQKLAAILKDRTNSGTKVDEIQIFIKPANNVKYKHIISVYTAALQAGFTKIGFQTSEG